MTGCRLVGSLGACENNLTSGCVTVRRVRLCVGGACDSPLSVCARASLLSPPPVTTCAVYGGGGTMEDPASIPNTHQTPSRTLSVAFATPGCLPTVCVRARARKPKALKIALLNPQGFNSCRPTLYHLSRARQAKPRGGKTVTAHGRVGGEKGGSRWERRRQGTRGS